MDYHKSECIGFRSTGALVGEMLARSFTRKVKGNSSENFGTRRAFFQGK
jgi:hypothetical protein